MQLKVLLNIKLGTFLDLSTFEKISNFFNSREKLIYSKQITLLIKLSGTQNLYG